MQVQSAVIPSLVTTNCLDHDFLSHLKASVSVAQGALIKSGVNIDIAP